MSIDLEEAERYSGEEYYRRPPRLNLPYLRMQGEKGSFILGEKDENTGEFSSVNIGDSAEGIVLRIRRRLSSFEDGIRSIEHNTPNDEIILYQEGRAIDKGLSKDIKAKNPRLKTEHVVYFYYAGKVVKLIVRGGSLGSIENPDDPKKFYNYLGSFKGAEHVWQYSTILHPKKEQNKKTKKVYYCIDFEKGQKLEEIELETVISEMKRLHEFFIGNDNFYRDNNKNPVIAKLDGKKDKVESLSEKEITQVSSEEEFPNNLPDLPF